MARLRRRARAATWRSSASTCAPRTAATAVRSRPEGGWTVDAGRHGRRSGRPDAGAARHVSADAVIVATAEADGPPPAGARRARPRARGRRRPRDRGRHAAARRPRADARPRGTGVLTVPGSHTAKALTHSTAKWDVGARARRATGTSCASRSARRARLRPRTGTGRRGCRGARAAEASALLGVALAPAALRRRAPAAIRAVAAGVDHRPGRPPSAPRARRSQAVPGPRGGRRLAVGHRARAGRSRTRPGRPSACARRAVGGPDAPRRGGRRASVLRVRRGACQGGCRTGIRG